MSDLPISQAAIDLIVAEEVSSKETYQARYQHPEWPGGASGITIGIGYDCGYSTPVQIVADWGTHLAPAMISALTSVAGLTGARAHDQLDRVLPIVSVPWVAAMDVFENRDMPKWIGTVRAHLPNTEKLAPDCLGVLVSLAYNRGPSFDTAGDRYTEMRAIKAHMAAEHFGLIPGDLRAMQRLWASKSMRGVFLRREHEARLFERGLATMTVAHPPSS